MSLLYFLSYIRRKKTFCRQIIDLSVMRTKYWLLWLTFPHRMLLVSRLRLVNHCHIFVNDWSTLRSCTITDFDWVVILISNLLHLRYCQAVCSVSAVPENSILDVESLRCSTPLIVSQNIGWPSLWVRQSNFLDKKVFSRSSHSRIIRLWSRRSEFILQVQGTQMSCVAADCCESCVLTIKDM